MIFEFPEFSKTAKVVWCRADATLDPRQLINRIRSRELKLQIQFLDAVKVAGRDHAYFAVFNALNAFKDKRNISKSLAVEILLYASARRQIEDAIKTLGISSATQRVVCIAVGESGEDLATLGETLRACGFGAVYDDEPLDLLPEKSDALRRAFSIGTKEISAVKRGSLPEHEILTRLVIERMALLSVAA